MDIFIVDGPGKKQSAPELSTKITQYNFRSRFTLAEKANIEGSAVINPLVRAVVKDFDSAEYIDLTSPFVQEGIGVFVEQSLITEARAGEILEIANTN